MNMNYSNNYDNADIISVNADANVNVNVNDHSRNNALPFNAPENSYSTGFI